MHRRRERQQHRERRRNQLHPLRWVPAAVLRPGRNHRAARRRVRRQWSYYVVHVLACEPASED